MNKLIEIKVLCNICSQKIGQVTTDTDVTIIITKCKCYKTLIVDN